MDMWSESESDDIPQPYSTTRYFRQYVMKVFLNICKSMNEFFPDDYDNDDDEVLEDINEELSMFLSKRVAYCDVCDEKLVLLNNDIDYSMQIHQQDPEHLKIVDNFVENLSHSKSWTADAPADNKTEVNKSSNYIVEDEADGFVFCQACDTFLFNIGLEHLASKEHDTNYRKLPIGSARKWEILHNRFLRCIACNVEYDLQEHTSSQSHKENVKSLRMKSFTMSNLGLNNILKEKTEEDVFNKLLIHVPSPEVMICACCNVLLDSISQCHFHVKQEEHKSYVATLRESNILSDLFGIIRTEKMWHCILCHVGITNIVEFQWHLHGRTSRHRLHLTEFRNKIFVDCDPASIEYLFQVENEYKFEEYSLDLRPVDIIDRPVIGDMREFLFIRMDNIGFCTLCDVLVLTDFSIHASNERHMTSLKDFKFSLTKNDRSWGTREKDKNTFYCYICHVGLSRYTFYFHTQPLTPHLERLYHFKLLNIKSDECEKKCRKSNGTNL